MSLPLLHLVLHRASICMGPRYTAVTKTRHPSKHCHCPYRRAGRTATGEHGTHTYTHTHTHTHFHWDSKTFTHLFLHPTNRRGTGLSSSIQHLSFQPITHIHTFSRSFSLC